VSRTTNHPCLVAEVIEEMAAWETAGAPAKTRILRQPLTQRQRLELHVGIFFIAGWNMAAIDFAYSSHHLWFWPWLTGWAALLVVHTGLVFLGPRVTARRRRTGPKARGSLT
jgi:fatty acid desaturase